MDRHKDKTKEELIIELKELQQELNAIKLANKKVKSNKTSFENEERYRYLFESNPQPMWIYDIESLSFLEINNAAIHHYGYSKEEFLGMTIKDIRPKEDIEALQKDIELTHQAYNLAGEWRHLKKNGENIFVEIISHAITFNNRKARHVMANDITLQKKALEDRTEALMLYNALIDQAGDAFFVHDFDGKFIEVNQQACDTLGYSKEELLKLSVADVEMDFDLKSAKKEWVKIERGHKFTVYGNHIRKDGTAFPVEVRFGCAQRKGQKLFLALARDITERNKAAESLRQSEENLYITLNSIGDGVIATDLNGRVVNMNPVAAKLCGWSLIDAAGKPLNEVFNIVNADTRETVINPVKKVLENGEIIGLANHTVLISENGTEYQISDSAAPIKNKEGKISGVVLVFSDETEKYLNEQSLIENEERLNLFFKQSLTGFFFMETDHPIIWDDTIDKEKTLDEVFGKLHISKVNQAMLDQYLTTEDEFINRTLNDFFAHDIKQGRKVIKDLFDKGILHIDTSERRADGTQIWIEGDYICLHDSKGRIKGLFGTQHDITARKQAAKSLQESEEKFKNIFHNHSAVKIIINPENGNIVEANLAAANFYGWTIAELQQMNLSQINVLPPEQLKKEMEKARALKKTQFEFKHRKADGSIIDVEVFSSKIVFDNKEFLHSIIHDITEKKKNEEQIRLFKEAVEQSPASNIITDTQGNIVYVNPKTLKVTGYELSELIGQNPKIFSAGEKAKEEYKVLWQNIASGKEWQGEFHNKKKNGELFWELASISPIVDDKGQITHYLAVKEDITERKQLLQDLIITKEQAEQSDKLKSAFLANMSHEIRTPMNSILGFTDLLKEPETSNEKQQKYIDVIQKSGTRLLNIINDIVDISKIEAGLMKVDIKVSNIKEQIEYTYTFFKPEIEKKGLQFFAKNSSLEEDLMIETDHEKIYAIFTNLIKNAIKFTNNGFIIFGYERKDEYLEFYVKDTGIGIPIDRREAIFERFIQADVSDKMALQGAGLGLSITKAYIELLGGKIWVESEVENLAEGKTGGSTFYFTIPCNTSPALKTDNQKAAFTKTFDKKVGNLKILIAEDDEASSIYLSILVEEFSSQLLMAKNGLEAVEIYKNNLDVDLILMDIQMPNLNGYDATSQIRQLNKKVIIIAQTAFALSYDKQKVIDAGCNDYISKPILMDDLDTIIRKYFK